MTYNYTETFDRYTDDQLITITKRHAEKFDNAWKVCMRSHYRTSHYIDAHAVMDREYEVLGQLHNYIYSHRPAALHDRFADAANWRP